ncbi:TRAP transporter substrate-binding protein [Pseudochelatococcus sp. B33]
MLFLSKIALGAVLLAVQMLPAAARDIRLVHDITSNHPRIPYIDAVATSVAQHAGASAVIINPDDVVYPGFASVEALQNAKAEVALVNASNLERIDPRLGFVNLPFTLSDALMTETATRDGVVTMLDDVARQSGWRVLGLMRGADQLFVFRSSKPTTVSDLRGLTIRVAGSGIYETIMRNLAVEPVVMPFPELRKAFEQKRVDGVFTSPGGWISQFGMEAPNALHVPGLMMITYAVIMRAEVLDALAEEDRSALADAVSVEVTGKWSNMLADDDAILAQMEQGGAHLVRAEADDSWRAPLQSVSADYAERYTEVWQEFGRLLSSGRTR